MHEASVKAGHCTISVRAIVLGLAIAVAIILESDEILA
jgi:hypothetical protein